jgi:hypothetical protein
MVPCKELGEGETLPFEEEFTDRHFFVDWELCVAIKVHHVPGEYSFNERSIDSSTILPVITKHLPNLTIQNKAFKVCHLDYLFEVILTIVADQPLPPTIEPLLDKYLQGWYYEFSLPSSKRMVPNLFLCETTYLILLGMGFENERLVGAFEQLLIRGKKEAKHYVNLLGEGETRFGSVLLPLVKKRFSILLEEEDRNGDSEEFLENDWKGLEGLGGLRGIMDNKYNLALYLV